MSNHYSFFGVLALLGGGFMLFLVSLLHVHEHIERHHYHLPTIRRMVWMTA